MLLYGVYIWLNIEGCIDNKVVKKYIVKMGFMWGCVFIRRMMEYLK